MWRTSTGYPLLVITLDIMLNLPLKGTDNQWTVGNPWKKFVMKTAIGVSMIRIRFCRDFWFLCHYRVPSVPDPESVPYFFTPWIRDEFCPYLGSRIWPLFWWNFLTLSSESLLCYLYETGQLLKLTPETICSKKKVCLVLLPLFT
jgi:hypothetical protein